MSTTQETAAETAGAKDAARPAAISRLILLVPLLAFLALAALADTSSPKRWLRVVLAGLAVAWCRDRRGSDRAGYRDYRRSNRSLGRSKPIVAQVSRCKGGMRERLNSRL